MLSDAVYNKIKLMHELSSLLWFIQKHAAQDAQTAGDAACVEMLGKMEKDLEKYLNALVCQTGICGEGKKED